MIVTFLMMTVVAVVVVVVVVVVVAVAAFVAVVTFLVVTFLAMHNVGAVGNDCLFNQFLLFTCCLRFFSLSSLLWLFIQMTFLRLNVEFSGVERMERIESTSLLTKAHVWIMELIDMRHMAPVVEVYVDSQ